MCSFVADKLCLVAALVRLELPLQQRLVCRILCQAMLNSLNSVVLNRIDKTLELMTAVEKGWHSSLISTHQRRIFMKPRVCIVSQCCGCRFGIYIVAFKVSNICKL